MPTADNNTNTSSPASMPTSSMPPTSMPPQEILQTPPPPPSFIPPQEINSPVTPPVPPAKPKLNLPLKKIIIALVLFLLLGLAIVLGLKFIPQLLNKNGISQVNLTWWGLWENDAVVQPLIAEYESQHPNVKVTYIQQSKEDYRERLTNALAQGKGPDIFRYHNSWIPMFKSQLEPLPASVMSQSDFANSYYPVILSDLSTNSGILGMPLDFDTLGLYINQDIFDTYGKVAPTTWDELRQTALDLTIKDQTGNIKQSGVALGRVENVDHWQEILSLMMMQNGVTMNTMSSPDRVENALNFFTIFSKTDKVWDDTLPPSTVAFANGKVAMYLAPSWRAHEIKATNPKLKFSVFPVPQLPKERPDDPSIAYASYWVEGVSKSSPAKSAAWDFMKFIASKESLEKMYQNQIQNRLFGEIYPRTDLAQSLSSDPIAGAFVNQGRDAKSWFLQSLTWDGATGINTQISKYFEDAISGINKGSDAKSVSGTVTNGVLQVLSQYGLAQAPATPKP